MGKRLLIFGLLICVATMACVGAPDNVEGSPSSDDAKQAGGSLHIDSFRATSAAKTGSATSKFSTADTPKNKRSSPYTADSLNKKKQ